MISGGPEEEEVSQVHFLSSFSLKNRQSEFSPFLELLYEEVAKWDLTGADIQNRNFCEIGHAYGSFAL